MKRRAFWIPGLVVLLLGAAPALASSYSQIKAITGPNIPPAGAWSLDISWVDPGTRRDYLADRTNNAVDVANTSNDSFDGQIGKGLFAGATGVGATSGPNGVLVIDHPHQLWVGDGNSTVKVFDLDSSGDQSSTGHCRPNPTLPADCVISTGGTTRADELTYDARDNQIVITNDAESPPYLSFISVESRKVIGKVKFPDATDGIEQPAYEPQTHKIFQAVPKTAAHPGGEIDVLEPLALKITQVHPLQDCTPHGLAVGADRNLVVGCSGQLLPSGSPLVTIIMNSRNGHLAATLHQVGGSDEVWYNPGDNHYYTGSSRWTNTGLVGGTRTPVLGVIDAGTNTFIQNVPTSLDSHSVAADPHNNHIYVPLDKGTSPFGGGIGVFAN
jgi:hypothetical protein